jgi:TonB family protein
MKRTMLAILAISPLMLHAQAKSSAQPESTPVLQSRNIQPAVFVVGKSTAAVAATVATPVRISTGVVAPVLIHTAPLSQNGILPAGFVRNRSVDVQLTVDKDGKPTNVKVVKSAGEATDNEVLSAISEYRYKPATLDGAAIPIDVNLSVNIQ